jgi:hypothetical protein
MLQVSTDEAFHPNFTKTFRKNSAPSVNVTLGLDELPFLQFGIKVYVRATASSFFATSITSNYSEVKVTLLVGKCPGDKCR